MVTTELLSIKSAVLRTLKNKLRQKKKNRFIIELKGSATTFEIKQYFYRHLASKDKWYLQSIILDKYSLAKHPTLISNKHRLYNILSRSVLDGVDAITDSSIVHLYVDKSKNTHEIDKFDTYIRSNLEINMPENATLNIEHLNSEINPGIQAVDMFCYGISRKYEHKDDRWYNLFNEKIKREIIFRP